MDRDIGSHKMALLPAWRCDQAALHPAEVTANQCNNSISAHDRNTKLNLANAYQIKNEAID